MSERILLYSQNKELTEQVKSYIKDIMYSLESTDNIDKLYSLLNSQESSLLVYDFLETTNENQNNLANILSEYPFQLVILLINREEGDEFLQMMENYHVYDIVSYPIYKFKFHFAITKAVTYGKVMSKISDFKSN